MYRVVFVLLLFIVSCDKSFEAPKPDNLIEQEQMEEILYDIKLLKAAKSKSYKILKDNNVYADVYIYEKYKLDSVTLRQNIAYYSSTSFKRFKEIEHNVLQRFTADKKEIVDGIAAKDSLQKIQDSINKPKQVFKSEIYKSKRPKV